MAITAHPDLTALQASVRTAVGAADINEALSLLQGALPAGRPKHNQVVLLVSRLRDIHDYEVGNRLGHAQLEILRNELRHDVLLFTDRLRLADFSEQAPGRPELRPGHLLYRVPPRMAIRECHECLIRVAHELSQVLEGIELDEAVTLEEVPVAEVMEVEIIDPSPDGARAFDILLLSDGEQLVDAYSYTEWVFNVRPLREGDHQLVLKISVLISVRGKERTKNIVLRRPIEVTAMAVAAAPPPFQRAVAAGGDKAPPFGWDEAAEVPPLPPPPPSYRLPNRPLGKRGTAEPAPPPPPPPVPAPAPAPAPSRRPPIVRLLAAAATVLLLATVGLFTLRPAGDKEPDTGIEQPIDIPDGEEEIDEDPEEDPEEDDGQEEDSDTE